MLKKRIIPCLDVKAGRTVKGVNFQGLRDAGDPVELARRYAAEGADELVFLDITATDDKRAALLPLVEAVNRELNLPFTVGGGISRVEEARALVAAGADKVSVNSAAVARPGLLSELADALGSQAVVLAVDSRREGAQHRVYTHGGKRPTERYTAEWIQEGVARGAGEILLTAMDADGTRGGFDQALYEAIRPGVPLIASGGAGSEAHFAEVLKLPAVTGALAASVFHFGQIGIPALKSYLKTHLLPIR